MSKKKRKQKTNPEPISNIEETSDFSTESVSEIIEEVQEIPSTPPPPKKSDSDKVLDYLQKNGASLSTQIAKSLNMDTRSVVKSLIELRQDGRIHLK